MKIGIIGAGFGGLSAGYLLSKEGFDVTIIEADEKPGGLAVGFKEPGWKWSIEKHYHHWFYSDWAIRNLAKEVRHKVIFERPKTSTYIDGEVYQLDSPTSLLRFSKLPMLDRLRIGAVLGYLKVMPDWRSLEAITAERFLKKYMGEVSWRILWQPLFEKKFSEYANKIPASWFWARIKKRSAKLGYPQGGYLSFAETLSKRIEDNGEIIYKTIVKSIETKNGGFEVVTDKEKFDFDRVICTLPSSLFLKVTKNLPERYKERLMGLKGLGAINLMLSLKKQFLDDGTYWLNVNERDFPFLGVIEHTNFMNKGYYGDEHMIYVGNYLPVGHRYYQVSAGDLLEEFLPFLEKINPGFSRKWVNKAYLFKTPFAQPIIPLNYSKKVPPISTPIKNLYLANIQQVYPWDRGTNYAVELGEKAADLVIQSA